MDENAFYFETKPISTVHLARCNKIATHGSGSSNHRLSACTAVASDGTKVPLFVIFKGQPMRQIERNTHKILPNVVLRCCLSKTWMGQREMKIWNENIWKPYAQNASKSLLLLNDFICHKHPRTVGLKRDVDTDPAFIPGGYTCVFQRCDVGIMKSLKNSVPEHYIEWRTLQ